MSEVDLTPHEIKQQHSAEIVKSVSFKTFGVSKEAALDYLETPEGEKYFQHLKNASPGSELETINDRAVQQITSGRELPRMVTIGPNEPLVKLTRLGDDVSPYSAYLTKESTVNEALASGRSLHDYFGLPVRSEAPRYRMDEFRPLGPTEVFISHVAPTSELGGQVTRAGGGEQYLAPNRSLLPASNRLRNVDNTLNLAAEAEHGLSLNLMRGAGVLAAGTIAYEGVITTAHSVDLLREGNVTGAESQMLHFGSRTVGGLGLGAAGAELGSFVGPVGTVAGGAIGYGVGAFGGEKMMEAYDNHKIYNQADGHGQTWSYDPKQPQQGWTYDLPALPETPRGQHFTAAPELANRLFYQANSTAVELAMGRTGKPADRYTQQASAKDTESFGNPTWQRSAQTAQWTRQINAPFVERQPMPAPTTEPASPHRAAQLDAAARDTIAQNLRDSKQGIAEQYQSAYEKHDWQQFGPMPEDVSKALRTPSTTLQASNGHTYTRADSGQWTTPGMIYGTNTAEGNVRQELDATRAARMATSPDRSALEPAHVAQVPSAFVRDMSAKLDRFEHAMRAGDRAGVMKEVAHVYQSPAWLADYQRAKEVAAQENQQREQQRAQNFRDPRDAGHPDHAMNQSIRKQVETLHERAGIFVSNKELDHLTASVANDARRQGLSEVYQVQFNGDRSTLVATQNNSHHHVLPQYIATDIQQAMQTPPEHAYQQMAQETQHQAHMQQNIQQQAAQAQQQGPSLGR